MYGRRSTALSQKSMNSSRLGQTSTLTIYTRDKQVKYIVPSVFALPSGSYFKNRRILNASNFAKKVNESNNTSTVKISDNPYRFPSSVRLIIVSLVCQLRRHPKSHFNSREIATVLQMYYAITGYKVRLMTQMEFEDFLIGCLGITNMHTLAGLKRVTVQMFDDTKRPERLGIPPDNFVLMLSVYLRGSLLEKAEIAFRIMDIDRDGYLRRHVEFKRFLAGSFEPEIAATHADIDPEQPVRESIQYLQNIMGSSADGGVDMKKFQEVVVKHPWVIDCLFPITCREINNLAFQSLITPKASKQSCKRVKRK